MSAGFDFLRKAMDEGEWRHVRRATPELFTEEELPVFEWVLTYLDTYHEMPDHATAQEELGRNVPRSRQAASLDYFYDTLKRRFAYSSVNDLHPQLVATMTSMDVPGMLDVLRQMVASASSACGGNAYSTLQEEMAGVIADYEYAKSHPGLRGITTGWPTLDLATNGLMGGDLVVLAGRPSMGKSYLLMEMAYAANLTGKTICLTSMEMPKDQIARRWLGRASGFNPNYIRAGELGTYAEEAMRDVAETIRNSAFPVHLLAGDMRKSIAGIEAMVVEFSPDILFVDAAYLLSPTARKGGGVARWEMISEVVRELKELALRYNIPVVISVQFNRNRKNKPKRAQADPDMGDIAGSDSIPQDASIVLGIEQGPSPNQTTQRIVHCMKNREGETPKFATSFTFSPVDMSEVPLVLNETEEPEEDSGAGLTDWMP